MTAPARRWSTALQEFLQLESAGGLILMGTTVLALVVANSPLAGWYEALLATPVEVRVGALQLGKPLLLWVNDGLMAVFFLLVGLELKREVLDGHLSSLRQAALPLFAAAGGMLGPAAIYWAANRGDAVAMRGWAIPAATDIAFALGILSLLGPRVPAALKALLLSVAIFDDLGAIVIIAVFYTAELSFTALMVAGGLLAAMAVLNRAGIVRPAAYILLGLPLWVAVLKSGVHATLAGVAVAMFIPLRAGAAGGDASPLKELEHTLHPWVAFGVLPVFAFANAGVPLAGLVPGDLLRPLPLGIAAGLLLGKTVGIGAFAWLAVRARVAALPAGMGWGPLVAMGLLCGVGFTMSLFITSLAFEFDGEAVQRLGRLGVLSGSLVAGVAGYLALRMTLRPEAAGAPPDMG